jgi:hypothetical protein
VCLAPFDAADKPGADLMSPDVALGGIEADLLVLGIRAAWDIILPVALRKRRAVARTSAATSAKVALVNIVLTPVQFGGCHVSGWGVGAEFRAAANGAAVLALHRTIAERSALFLASGSRALFCARCLTNIRESTRVSVSKK